MQTRELKELEERFANRRRLDDEDAEELRRALLSDDGQISVKEASFLARLRARVPDRTPGFERFFYDAIRHHVTDDDLFSARDGKRLWDLLFADGQLDERDTQLLCEIKERVRAANPDYEYLLAACVDARTKQGAPG